MTDRGDTTRERGDGGRFAARDTEHDIRAAFEMLRHDASMVDTTAALEELRGERRWLRPLVIVGAMAALLVLALMLVEGGDGGDSGDGRDGENVVAVDDGDAVDAATAGDVVGETTGDDGGDDADMDGGAPLVVDGEGFDVVDPDSGAVRRLPFGSPAGQVLEVLDGLLGDGERNRADAACPNRADRTVRWTETGLQVELRGGELISWSLGPGSAITTRAGVGLGSTRTQLEQAYVVGLVDSTLGVEFVTGTDPGVPDVIGGLLSGRGGGATITALWAGEICALR